MVLAIYFSSSGIESLRIGLNRAYNETEMRPWWLLRLESIAYVLVGAAGLVVLSFLIVLGPLIFHTALPYAPWLARLEAQLNLARYGIATVVLVVALVLVHKWLPFGSRRLADSRPAHAGLGPLPPGPRLPAGRQAGRGDQGLARGP